MISLVKLSAAVVCAAALFLQAGCGTKVVARDRSMIDPHAPVRWGNSEAEVDANLNGVKPFFEHPFEFEGKPLYAKHYGYLSEGPGSLVTVCMPACISVPIFVKPDTYVVIFEGEPKKVSFWGFVSQYERSSVAKSREIIAAMKDGYGRALRQGSK